VTTEERIVRAMAELMRTRGYAGTGMKQLAEAAGAPVGSIYHHFPGGKLAVAAEVLRTTGAAYIELVPLLLDPHPDLTTGVGAAFETAAEDMLANGWANMCPVGTITGEVADSEPELREVAAEVVAGWVATLSAYLRERGLGEEDARSASYALLSALEGAFVLARGLRSTEPLLAAGRATAALVAAMPRTVTARR
jgi:AcrR family transcriptional regulator